MQEVPDVLPEAELAHSTLEFSNFILEPKVTLRLEWNATEDNSQLTMNNKVQP